MHKNDRSSLMLLTVGYALFSSPIGFADSTLDSRRSPVAVLPLRFTGDLVNTDRAVLSQRFLLGLNTSELQLISGDPVDHALLSKRPSGICDENCRRSVAAALKVRVIVGGEVHGNHDNYALHIWAADGTNGNIFAEVDWHCDICGVTELANTMQLTASTLQAKLRELRPAAAIVEVRSIPRGAALIVDGRSAGLTPRRLQLPPGEHSIAVRADGHREARRNVRTTAGEQERIDVILSPMSRPSRTWRRPVGWIAIGTGVIAGVIGSVLLGLDGQRTNCESGEIRAEYCQSTRNTAIGGGVTLGMGLVAIGTGVYLLLTTPAAPERAEAAPN